MERDSDIKPILPSYSIVDRVQDASKQRKGSHGGRAKEESKRKDEAKSDKRRPTPKVREHKARSTGRKLVSDAGKTVEPEVPQHEPGELIDLRA